MSTSQEESPSSAVIEVERKFICPENIRERLKQLNAKEIKSQTFTDSYYDNSRYTLTLADHWLRSRNGLWQLKCPPPNRIVSATTAQYLEKESESEIIRAITHLFPSCSDQYNSMDELLAALNLKAFAKYQTSRKQFKLGEFLIVLDEADFGYTVGEVEKVVSYQEDVPKTLEEVDQMVKDLGVESCRRIPGKMEAFLQKSNPDHLQQLLDTHVLGELRHIPPAASNN